MSSSCVIRLLIADAAIDCASAALLMLFASQTATNSSSDVRS